MYKVILVDDEAIIREGLKSRIDWEAYGFELVGDYANGLEAQVAIVADPPDLIISDICMPFVDGLELAEFVQQHHPDTKMIILTGFDEFEYARRAIRLKVSDFILKPVTAKEIRELLKQIKLEMDEDHQLHQNIDQLQDQWSQSLPLLKEHFWEKVLTTGVTDEEWEQQRHSFALPALSSPYGLAVIEPVPSSFEYPPTEKSLPSLTQLRDQLSHLLQHLLPPELVFTSCIYQSRCVFIFSSLSASSESTLPFLEQIEYTIKQVYNQSQYQLNCVFTTGLGAVCTSLSALPQQHQQAMQALEYQFLWGTGILLSFSTINKPVYTSSLPNIDWEKEIVTQLSNNNVLEAQRLSQQMAQQMVRERISPTACVLQFRQIALRLHDWLHQLGMESVLSKLMHQDHWLTAPTLEKILQQWLSALHDVSAHLNEQVQMNSQQHIQKAIHYIEHHYADAHLSLQDICSHVLMSTSSFSQAFKQYTEVTYVEYLTRIRMDKAKELLRLTEYKFYHIAEKVGYTDPNYFSSSFKKHTGITPKQYREQHRQVKELHR